MASKEKKKPEKRGDSSKSEIAHLLKTRPLIFVGSLFILIIVVIAFVFLPAIVPDAMGGGDLIFGYYNGVPIRYVPDNFFFQVQQSLAQQHQIPTDDPFYSSRVAELWRAAFEETVVRMAILDEMNQAGFVAPTDVVDREVAALPMFQENGVFSAARYRAMDRNSQMNLWRQVQEGIAIQQYLSDLSELRTTSNEAAFISAMAAPRRSFDVAVFPLNSYPDSEVALFIEENPDLFMMTRLSIITLGSERDAQQVLDSLRNGSTTFEEAARANSLDRFAEQGGDMGLRLGVELVSEIFNDQDRERVINLSPGAISDVVRVQFGWAFFRAEEASYRADLDDPGQTGQIRNHILTNLRGRAEDWIFEEAERFIALAQERSFEEAAFEGNVLRRYLGPISLNYGSTILFSSIASAGVPEVEQAEENQFFWRAAFSTPINAYSRPLVIGNNVLVLHPLEETDMDEESMEFIAMYIPFWVDEGMQFIYRRHFLEDNDKLDDRFWQTFLRIFSF